MVNFDMSDVEGIRGDLREGFRVLRVLRWCREDRRRFLGWVDIGWVGLGLGVLIVG